MRPRRWIVALLLTMAASSAPAAGQPATGVTVGTVYQAQPLVKGTLDGTPPVSLSEQSHVSLQMKVTTGPKKAAAHIVLDSGSKRGPKDAWGAVHMGPESAVRFTQWLVEKVNRPAMSFEAMVGNFLFFFRAQPSGQPEGPVRIETRASKIQAHGTALRVEVTPKGITLLYVLEGWVEVTGSKGRTVRVHQGSWTAVVPGQAPLSPLPSDSLPGTLSPRAHGPAFDVPGEVVVVDPPFLDLRRLTLDLPKVWRP